MCAATLFLGWKAVPETGGGCAIRLGLGRAALVSLTLAAIVVPLPEGREQGGVAAGIVNSAMRLCAAVSVAVIGGLFFKVLGNESGERVYAHAFAIAQGTATAGLFLAMLIAIPPQRRIAAVPR